jgi:hypothetical protein
MRSEISTGKIQVYRYLIGKSTNGQLFIDWATSLLEQGYDSPSLRILAGFVSEDYSSFFELESYLLKSLEELNIPVLGEDDAIKAYAYEILTEMVNNEIEKEKALNLLSEIVIEKEYPSYLFDFYLLHFSLDDLKYSPFAFHWKEATKENIDQIIIQTVRDWLEKHQDCKIG